jgi:hypothetical protein
MSSGQKRVAHLFCLVRQKSKQRDVLLAVIDCYDEQRDQNTHYSYPG